MLLTWLINEAENEFCLVNYSISEEYNFLFWVLFVNFKLEHYI